MTTNNQPRSRVRVEYTREIRDKLDQVVANTSNLELRFTEKLETSHRELSREIGRVENAVTDLRAGYASDKESIDRRVTALEKANDQRPQASWNKASVIITLIGVCLASLLGLASLIVSLFALHAI